MQTPFICARDSHYGQKEVTLRLDLQRWASTLSANRMRVAFVVVFHDEEYVCPNEPDSYSSPEFAISHIAPKPITFASSIDRTSRLF
jgi:hypothetical protein